MAQQHRLPVMVVYSLVQPNHCSCRMHLRYLPSQHASHAMHPPHQRC
jgi:hypothetical protein